MELVGLRLPEESVTELQMAARSERLEINTTVGDPLPRHSRYILRPPPMSTKPAKDLAGFELAVAELDPAIRRLTIMRRSNLLITLSSNKWFRAPCMTGLCAQERPACIPPFRRSCKHSRQLRVAVAGQSCRELVLRFRQSDVGMH